MSQETQIQDNELDAISAALLQQKSADDINQTVKAEDLPMGSGIDYSKIFWEPQVGKSYTVKMLKNIEDVVFTGESKDIIHRRVYKNLPDPQRKGKTFQLVSSGDAKTDKVLELFFELNALKKAGDAMAEAKIDEFLGNTNQGCSVVQVLSSPDAAEVGIIRLFVYSTFGPNATIANLLNSKLNPSEEKLKRGAKKEDVFNIFSSSLLFIECTEATYEDRKGRDFTKSEWLTDSKEGAWVRLENGQEHKFSLADLEADGSLKPAVKPFFMELIRQLKDPNLSIHNYFAYKTLGHPKNTDDTNKYLEQVAKKVDEIVPVIRNAKDIAEIKNYGIAAAGAAGGGEQGDSAKSISGASAADILKNSAPVSELENSVLGDVMKAGVAAPAPEARAEFVNPAAGEKSSEIDDILNG